ncbi:hypothetical protein BJ165DRAFT_1516557 [Panaeolus papilionaceus]|nr:hypothetical protein BJ165DRAFT_1516557 [Panaeolus papilionaceus]
MAELLSSKINDRTSRNRGGKKVANRQFAQFAQLALVHIARLLHLTNSLLYLLQLLPTTNQIMKNFLQNLSRPSSPALRNADGGTSGRNTRAVSPAQSRPEGGTIQTLKITVLHASNIPLPKISVTRRRRFYVIVTDETTAHKTSSEKPNANTNTVTWNERIADFHLYSASSHILLHLFVEERFGEDTLVGDCSFPSSAAVVTPVEIALELHNVNAEVLRHTTALPSIHLEFYTTPNVGLLSSSSTPPSFITARGREEHAPATRASMPKPSSVRSASSEIARPMPSPTIFPKHPVSHSHTVDAFSSSARGGQVNEIYTPATPEHPSFPSKVDIPAISIPSPTMAISRHTLDSSNSENQQPLPDAQSKAGILIHLA